MLEETVTRLMSGDAAPKLVPSAVTIDTPNYLPDDYVVFRPQRTWEQGEMCAAMTDGEATLKFFRRTPAGRVFLDPANDGYEPIPVPPGEQASILGRVVAVLRSL